MMLDFFTNAFEEVATRKNTRSCFIKAGITPLNCGEPLLINFIFDNKEIYGNIRETFLNSKCININDDTLKALLNPIFSPNLEKSVIMYLIGRSTVTFLN